MPDSRLGVEVVDKGGLPQENAVTGLSVVCRHTSMCPAG
jgi:hypothetical protein